MAIQDHNFQGESQPQSSSQDEVNVFCQLNFPQKIKNSSLKQITPVALAYLGDAVYELYIRSLFLLPPKRIHDYHQQVVSQVRAETQASHLQKILPYLTTKEKEMVRRGRNATKGTPKRLSLEIYQQATSLETLVGYLYLYDPPRLQYLFCLMIDS